MKIHKITVAFLLAVLLIVLTGRTVYAADAGIGIESGQDMPDFTVSLTDGTTATLSEILAEKDLVVLNVFASWCGPCEREFPEMEEVYQENRDRMEIISVSGDPNDTMEIIADYKAGHNLTFPMGLAGDGLSFLKITSFPTTILIDRGGKVGLIKIGAFVSKEDFEEKVGHFLSSEYDGAPLESEKAVNFTPYIIVGLLIGTLLLVIGRWGIFRKAGRKSWHSLIPFLSSYGEYAAAWKGWIGLIASLCLPVGLISNMAGLPASIYHCLLLLGLLLSIPESLKLAKCFGKGKVFGVLMIIPGFKEICRLILGLGKAEYWRPPITESAGR